ncbi:type VI secretion system lipoprotein TssJ [Klebsiella michiganensis]|uniref:type VI secretion system lipoprotein TssJ n=1 Tax=Klebsiella michiganensis TaxID=1134687 RepID=UPI00256FE6E8|nr:type VI secretion system lipoprotein TssJ [Klebsiella michiganensis]WJD74537.1 type VI secretion system lipoprotein TssJ [Klebsiella michiganensis]
MMMSASWRICGALLTVLSLAGCGLAQRAGQGATAVTDAIFYRKVDTLHLTLAARNALNTDEDGMSSPVEVRIWPLRNATTFNLADYRSLLKQGPKVLSKDLSAPYQAIRLTPGQQTHLDMPLADDTQFVALTAFFFWPDTVRNNWKLIIPRDALNVSEPTVVELNDRHLVLRKEGD